MPLPSPPKPEGTQRVVSPHIVEHNLGAEQVGHALPRRSCPATDCLPTFGRSKCTLCGRICVYSLMTGIGLKELTTAEYVRIAVDPILVS